MTILIFFKLLQKLNFKRNIQNIPFFYRSLTDELLIDSQVFLDLRNRPLSSYFTTHNVRHLLIFSNRKVPLNIANYDLVIKNFPLFLKKSSFY